MNGKIFLSGGGDEKQSQHFDSLYVNSFKGNKILYIPIALNRDAVGFEACNKWIHTALDPHTNRDLDIKMVLDISQISDSDLFTYDAIYIGGGNTYKLLDLVRQAGFDKRIIEFLDRKGIFYGGSAGAIIMGANIKTVKEERDREMDPKGLNLLNGYSVRCHIKEEDLDLMKSYSRNSGEIVLGLPEGSGLIYYMGGFTVVGDCIYHINNMESEKLKEGTVFK